MKALSESLTRMEASRNLASATCRPPALSESATRMKALSESLTRMEASRNLASATCRPPALPESATRIEALSESATRMENFKLAAAAFRALALSESLPVEASESRSFRPPPVQVAGLSVRVIDSD